MSCGRLRIATPAADYAKTIEAIASIVRALEIQAGQRGTGRPWNPRHDFPADRSRQERQLHLAERSAAFHGSRACARSQRAIRERCELLRVVGGHRRRGDGRRCCVWRRSSAPAAEVASPSTGGCSPAPTALRGSGGTTRCRRPRDDERPGPPCYCGKTGCLESVPVGARSVWRLRTIRR